MHTDTGSRLSTLRTARGLSQEQLAGELGVSRQAISNWERCESLPDTGNLLRLAEFYGVSVEEVIGRSAGADVATVGGDTGQTSDRAGTGRRWRPLVALVACFLLSLTYFGALSQPLVLSTVDDIAEVFALSLGPGLALVWIACEVAFVMLPFAVLAVARFRLPRWIWIAPAMAWVVPVLMSMGMSALGGAPFDYSGIGGALKPSVALKADVLAVVVGCALVHYTKRTSGESTAL